MEMFWFCVLSMNVNNVICIIIYYYLYYCKLLKASKIYNVIIRTLCCVCLHIHIHHTHTHACTRERERERNKQIQRDSKARVTRGNIFLKIHSSKLEQIRCNCGRK